MTKLSVQRQKVHVRMQECDVNPQPNSHGELYREAVNMAHHYVTTCRAKGMTEAECGRRAHRRRAGAAGPGRRRSGPGLRGRAGPGLRGRAVLSRPCTPRAGA